MENAIFHMPEQVDVEGALGRLSEYMFASA
jgi:hypothetical protein